MNAPGEPRIVASVIVRNEADRYLAPFLRHLAGFCAETRVLDDGSTDGWADRLYGEFAMPASLLARLKVRRVEESSFWQDEGAARQALLEWTLEADEPDYVLAIDADEFITDPAALVAACRTGEAVVTLNMQEIWKLSPECLCVRQDGGWREHPVPILWRVPGATVRAHDAARPFPLRQWRIPDRKVACGREPQAIRDVVRAGRHVLRSRVDVLHMGWACEADRQARYERYVEHDGGRYHAGAHLRSIMFPDGRVSLEARDWPVGLEDVRAALVARALRK